jgi:hypothetical protein
MKSSMNPKLLASLVAGAATSFCLFAHAADTAPADSTAPALTKSEAKDLKTQSDADFKARKKLADAKSDLGQADCKTSTEGGVTRACKSGVKAEAKQDKANAKMVHESEKADIKANSK